MPDTTGLKDYTDLTAMARNSGGELPRAPAPDWDLVALLESSKAAPTQGEFKRQYECDFHAAPVPAPAPSSPADISNALCKAHGIEYSPRPDPTSITVPYIEIAHETEKAICLSVADEDGELIDDWFPKGVCKNLTPDTIGVWEKFLADAKRYLYDLHTYT